MSKNEFQLKTCPFCGSDAWIVRPAGHYPPMYVVVCKNTDVCEASVGNYSPTRAEAANKWNRRSYMMKNTHDGCRYCPVECSNYEQINRYRGSKCAAARSKVGLDYDPEDVFHWKENSIGGT